MDTSVLKKFSQQARTSLLEQIEAQLGIVLAPDSRARRESVDAVKALEEKIEAIGKKQVVDQVAYTWFNRFCALRFMDVNRYNRVGIVSPAQNQTLPEILSNAIVGHIDSDVVKEKTRKRVQDLLLGKVPSRDAQGEAYRLLLVAYCNSLHTSMSFLFERIEDYTELLLPTNLLTSDSVLASCREAMTPEACKDVEVIGWLYQYYISERKDEVFASFKKGKKAGTKEIPAATQLFTPHWIVRYLVENSLGRLWMLNHPKSHLPEKMEYYIKSDQEETDFLRINRPEEIRVCDPACGSGHMLTYAFDLLYAIYEEEGYEASSIPTLILTKNLYGIEIDERAKELAAFALLMKARGKDKKFLEKPIQPNICALKNIKFEAEELKEYVKHVGIDLFTEDVLTTLNQFEEADNFGSLIIPATNEAAKVLEFLEKKDTSNLLFIDETHEHVKLALKQADYLSQKYHVVVANPPYMDLGNMNQSLKFFLEGRYEITKQNLDVSFLQRCIFLTLKYCYTSLITQRSWMFLSRIEDFRNEMLSEYNLLTMIYLGTGVFPEIKGEKVQNTAFVFQKNKSLKNKTHFYKLNTEQGLEKNRALLERKHHYYSDTDRLRNIPGFPIAFWASDILCSTMTSGIALKTVSEIRVGLDTGDNPTFIRSWHEPSLKKIRFGAKSLQDFRINKSKWVPHSKGGQFKKWYGNITEILAFDEENYYQLSNQGNKLPSKQFYFKPGLFYTRVCSDNISLRFSPEGVVFNSASPTLFPIKTYKSTVFALLNSKVVTIILECLSPTLNFQAGELRKLPLPLQNIENKLKANVDILVSIAQYDWDSFETSWDFTTLPLLDQQYRKATLSSTYNTLRAHWNEMTLEMQRLEEENNRIFIDAYGLEDELTPDVPLKEITLTCNPYYRYGDSKSDSELEALLLADTMKELISYAVGCMFGRYSIDKPGLVLANQGETYEDYCRLVPDSSFPADKDNVIPILDGEWFSDDIVGSFKKFLKVTFGEVHYDENLRFIEEAIGRDIRTYFLKDFYDDHVRRYKKRPIYWMFSSPRGEFNALIYMHRYRSDTVSVVRSSYLVDYISKITYRIEYLQSTETSVDVSKSDKTKALKQLTLLKKTLDELKKYEQDTLFPLAAKKVEIDLDDGVKVNYPKLGDALKKIAGLEAKEEE
jgi:hypothetical protein